MQTWIAERYTDSPDVWRDEDVAMSSEFHTFKDFFPDVAKFKARKMLVGMLMTDAVLFEDLGMEATADEHARAAVEVVQGAELVRIGQHVVFRIRSMDTPVTKAA